MGYDKMDSLVKDAHEMGHVSSIQTGVRSDEQDQPDDNGIHIEYQFGGGVEDRGGIARKCPV